MDWRFIHLPPQIIMGCDNYLYKSTYVLDKDNVQTEEKDCLWDASSYEIGEVFACPFGTDNLAETEIDLSTMRSEAENLIDVWTREKSHEVEVEELTELVAVLDSETDDGSAEYFYSIWY